MVALSVVFQACGGPTTSGSDTTANPSSVATGMTTRPTGTTTSVPLDRDLRFSDQVVEAGISILDEPGGRIVTEARSPVGPLTLTEYQVVMLEDLARSGAGLLGVEVDSLVGEIAPGVMLSGVMASHFAEGETAAARWGAELIGADALDDPLRALFPAAAIVLFVADLVRPAGGDSAPGPASENAAAVIAFEASARGLSPSCGDEMWVWVFEIVFALLNAAPEVLTAKWDVTLVPPLTNALATLAVLSYVAPLVATRTVTVAAVPPADRYAVGDEPDRVQAFVAMVSPLVGVPIWLEECAAAQGIDLPSESGEGSEATWSVSGLPTHGTEVSRDGAFDGTGSARLVWISGREQNTEGDEVLSQVVARVEVDQMLKSLLIGAFANAVGSASFLPGQEELDSLLADTIAELKVALFASTSAVATAYISHHVDYPCVVGEWLSIGYTADGQETAGGIGTMRVVISPDRVATVTFAPDAEVYARVEGISEVSRITFQGSQTVVLGDSTVEQYLGGNATMSVDVELDGWVPVIVDQPLVGDGPAGLSSYTCQGDTLVFESVVGSRFTLARVG